MRITIQMITNLQSSIITMGEQYDKGRIIKFLDTLKPQIYRLSPKQIKTFTEICVETACKQKGNFAHINCKQANVKGFKYS